MGCEEHSSSGEISRKSSGEIKDPEPKVTSRIRKDIPSDEDIAPSNEKCRELNEEGKTYTLEGNIVDDDLKDICIKIVAPGITLDCNNYYIKGNKLAYGIYSEQDKTTIINCKLKSDGSIQQLGW